MFSAALFACVPVVGTWLIGTREPEQLNMFEFRGRGGGGGTDGTTSSFAGIKFRCEFYKRYLLVFEV